MGKAGNIEREEQCIHMDDFTLYRLQGEWVARRRFSSISDEERKRLKAEYQATWRNLQRVWRAFGGGLNGLFTIREGRQLDYHKFLSLNLNPPVIALTQEQASAGATLAGPYQVSEGRLPTPVEVKAEEGMFLSNLRQEELERTDQVLFVMLQQMPGEWVAGRATVLETKLMYLHEGYIAMPRSEGQWGTFVLMRRQRDGSYEVSSQRLAGG